MGGKHYIPEKDSDFDVFFDNLFNYVKKKTAPPSPEWDFIPPTAVDALGQDKAEWKIVYAVAIKPHSPIDTAEKRRIRKKVRKNIRVFVNAFLRGAQITDGDRDLMGVPVHKTFRSPVPVPDSSPVLRLDTGVLRRIGVRYNPPMSESRGKPPGVIGVLIRWAILDHHPRNLEELVHIAGSTSPPLVLDFDESQRGRHVYFSACWVIQRQFTTGSFGPIVDAFVP